MSAETAMWGDPAATDRVDEYEADSVDDLDVIEHIYCYAKNMLGQVHNLDVTMCDAGTIEDVLALIETLKPHSVVDVRKRAREVAWDRETM